MQTASLAPQRQTRPLTSLPPDQQRDVWEEVVRTAPDGKVTAKHVEKVVETIRPRMKDLMPHEEELMSEEFKTAFEQMEIAIMNARALKWKTTSREVAERYVQILLDIINQ
jgi:uncharacterized Zn finger protein